MISFAVLRLIGVVVAASLVLGALYYVADAIGDHREAAVRAKIERAIEITNRATDAANGADEETLALAERLRVTALAAAKQLPASPQCTLTGDEALALGRIR